MALAFFTSPDAPVRCALQLSEAIRQSPRLQLRMGIHSGPVDQLADVNERSNIAGAGINTARRVMDCGDAGHILLSGRVADDLGQFGRWQPQLHDRGEGEVKHGVRLDVVNIYTERVGNAAIPKKSAEGKRKAARRAKSRVLFAVLTLGILIAGAAIFELNARNQINSARGRNLSLFFLSWIESTKVRNILRRNERDSRRLAKVEGLRVACTCRFFKKRTWARLGKTVRLFHF